MNPSVKNKSKTLIQCVGGGKKINDNKKTCSQILSGKANGLIQYVVRNRQETVDFCHLVFRPQEVYSIILECLSFYRHQVFDFNAGIFVYVAVHTCGNETHVVL